jgi:hypothetical protein
VLYERPPQFPVTEGWGIRVIVAIASLMRSIGALLAMFSTAALADFYLGPLLAPIPLPRGIGPSLLRAIPELIFFLAVTWALLRFGHKATLADLGLSLERRAMGETILFTLLGAAGLSVLVLPLVALGMGSFRAEPRIQDPTIVALCVALLFLASFGEELFLRGYALQTLIQPLHLLGAVIATNGIFAALHLGNPSANEYSVANTFLAGCVLTMIVVVRRSLWAATGAHFGWNLATPLLGVNLSGMPFPISGYAVEWRTDPVWSGGEYGPEGSALCTGLLLILLFLLVWLYYRPKAGQQAEAI